MGESDTIAGALSQIKNAQRRALGGTKISPSSRLLLDILKILKEEKYILDFKEEEQNQAKRVVVKLSNNINDINAIKPRFSVQLFEYEKFEKRYLPARNFGKLILSTNKGIMTHEEAKKKKLGGHLLCYVY